MKNFTKKCIQDHRNPIVKVSLPAQKLFFAAQTDDEKRLINDHQEHLKTILEHQRIEKRSCRAQAVWLPNEKIAQVTKVVKNLVKYFGFQNKDGLFLYPEEMLFLIETNRLEVSFNNNLFSIEKANEIVFKTTNISLPKYRIYKKMALLGYKLIRLEQIENKILNRKKKADMKRALEKEDTTESQLAKKIKKYIPSEPVQMQLEESNQSEMNEQNYSHLENSMSKAAEHVYNILEKISMIMPTDSFDDNIYLKPDYCIFSPMNLTKPDPDFDLFICEGNIPDQRNFNFRLPSIFATCIDDVAFYKFSNVHLPYI